MIRKVFLFLFFSFQIGAIIIARFTQERYFCWAPYDEISLYKIEVWANHQMLNAKEIFNRYHIKQEGRENRSIQHLINIISQYEQTYGLQDSVQVKLSYVTNGHPTQYWSWSIQK